MESAGFKPVSRARRVIKKEKRKKKKGEKRERKKKKKRKEKEGTGNMPRRRVQLHLWPVFTAS
jgi:hypothetical protein